MQLFAESLTEYRRLKTLQVNVGGLYIGSDYPIRIQTMTTADTMDTEATVAEAIRCIEAGAELVRITAPSKKEAENLQNIKDKIRSTGYDTPLVADIHFTPNAAEIAARIVEKVRINPGNFADKKKFEFKDYTDDTYREEIERINQRFTPLVKICKEYGTAMRIGTNHGSLSDRIMSRYGDTANGMVESAMEFLRIAEREKFYNIVLSMKSSNPIVMVEAYRLLVHHMQKELGHCYPLHLGVTEAGDGEDGRIKSAIGIGTLLEDGIGDTIRVSLTEDAELEVPVCQHIANRYTQRVSASLPPVEEVEKLPLAHTGRKLRQTFELQNIGDKRVPVVIADVSKATDISSLDLREIGYRYNTIGNKWNIGDQAADYIYLGDHILGFDPPGMLCGIQNYAAWLKGNKDGHSYPLYTTEEYLQSDTVQSEGMHFVLLDCYTGDKNGIPLQQMLDKVRDDKQAILCLHSGNENAVQSIRRMFFELYVQHIQNPAILWCTNKHSDSEAAIVHYAIETGALLTDGFGNGLMLSDESGTLKPSQLNSISFGILQASRARISKTEFISCPSCGRTLFDLQETTARIREVTHHLKGVKIAIMGCIVNGPGEMADADFGYVGSGPGKITLYKGKEVVKRNVPSETAVEELIALLKENDVWVEAEEESKV